MEIDNERVLLEDNQGKFVGKDGTYSFSYEELIEEMERSPERFSNNVVTRPLMQEYVFLRWRLLEVQGISLLE